MEEKLFKELYRVVKDFEQKTGSKVLYLTKSGSKLYGTDTENSDTDFKGVFLPSSESLLLKTDLDHFTLDSNKNEKNSKDDVDLTLHSVHSFFNNLSKSETGAVDLLYSMFTDKAVLFDKNFVELMKNNVGVFKNKNMKAFVGYAVGQVSKFGVKGARYGELDKFVKYLDTLDLDPQLKLSEVYPLLNLDGFNHVKFVEAPNDRSGLNTDVYLSVLGKMYGSTVTFEYMLERVKKLYNSFGHRTKKTAESKEKMDFKALSHALRVATEVKELLVTGFLKFPLQNADYLREVKLGNCDVDTVLDEVKNTLDEVDELLLESDLPEKVNKEEVHKLLLKLYN